MVYQGERVRTGSDRSEPSNVQRFDLELPAPPQHVLELQACAFVIGRRKHLTHVLYLPFDIYPFDLPFLSFSSCSLLTRRRTVLATRFQHRISYDSTVHYLDLALFA
jgi:hypothetical protein